MNYPLAGCLFYILVIILLPSASAAPCTDGVDCLCDCLAGDGSTADCIAIWGSDITTSNVVMCEDFDQASYHEDVPGAWYYPESPSAHPCFRGGGSDWFADYGAASNGTGLWHLGDGLSGPRGACACDILPGSQSCAASEWRADNLWNSPPNTSIDVQTDDEVDDEVSGLTLSNKTWANNYHMAWRLPVDETGGFHGKAYLQTGADKPITYFEREEISEIGVTFFNAYATNADTAFPDWDDCTDDPWKHEEWGYQGGQGPNAWPLFCDVGGGNPISSLIFGPDGAGITRCTNGLASAQMNVGSVACRNLGGDNYIVDSYSTHDRSEDWPLGEWGCIRAHIKLGSPNGFQKAWFTPQGGTEQTVLDITNLDTATLFRDQSWAVMKWNNYFNGNSDLYGPGDRTTETTYRYLDNYVIVKDQAPVPCEMIGFSSIPPVCGDTFCTGDETYDTCPQDCPSQPVCDDGTCDIGEDCTSCPQDCGDCPVCGDGKCNVTETCGGNDVAPSCNSDCGECQVCDNDGVCETGENNSNCPNDCPAASGGLVAHYTFETDASDSTGNGNDGTINGAINTAGKIGNGLLFDGMDDYIEIPNDSTLQISDELTIAAWINPNDQMSQNRIAAKRQGDSRNTYGLMIDNQEHIHFRATECTNLFIDFGTTFPGTAVTQGEWSHVAATFSDSQDTVKIYINGSEEASTNTFTITPCATNTEPLQIGGHTDTERWFNGSIDEVRIYNTVLSANEIQALYEGVTLNPGDLNGDEVVDIFDLVIVGSNFHTTVGPDHQADANGDEECDIADLIVVAQNFGNLYS